jgi:hypothetical protein
MNWKQLTNRPGTDKAKRMAIRLLIAGIVMMAVFLVSGIYNYFGDTKTIIIDVIHTGETPGNMYKSMQFSFGDYVTGIYGKLSYRPASLFTFFMLYNIGGLYLIDFLYFTIISILLFNTINKPGFTATSFLASNKILLTISFITIGMFIFKGLFFLLVANRLLLNSTHNTFRLTTPNSQLLYLFFGILLMIYVYFPNSNNALKPGQPLTN